MRPESREALTQILIRVASRFSFQGLEDWSVDLPDSIKILGAEREFHDLTKSGPMNREIRVYFRLKSDAASFARLVKSSFEDLKVFPPKLLAPKDWMREWRKHYRIQKIRAGGKTIFIVPAWKKSPKGKISVKVHPGQAFGTGTHPTTRLCLQIFLERADSLPLSGRLLDFGAGTGVLALCALALGKAKKHPISAVAVESDPEALSQCRKNMKLNGKEMALMRKIPARGRFDFVFANVLSPVLVKHKVQLAGSLKPGALLVVSGILENDGKNFLEKFCSPSLELVENKREGDWGAFLFQKK
jgi:ribosomal protein L11 methyltransferase